MTVIRRRAAPSASKGAAAAGACLAQDLLQPRRREVGEVGAAHVEHTQRGVAREDIRQRVDSLVAHRVVR